MKNKCENRNLYTRCEAVQPNKKYKFSVAIILRTKDRPLCLPRALISILNQSYKDWQLAIVNDGGDAEALAQRIKPVIESMPDRVVVINNPTQTGRGAAINAGIEATSSEFIVVHDDDDSWQQSFLEETVNYLSDPSNSDCGGVITHTARVNEEIVNNQIVERQRGDFNSSENNCNRVSLYRLMMQNTITTISFLYRRSVLEKIGNYNNLPVLEDWDFNIRFLLDFEIGVIPKHLANYHHRISQQDAAYSNSIIAQQSLCYQYETTIRNTGLRRLFNSKEQEHLLGLCLAMGGHDLPARHTPMKVDYLVNKTNELAQQNQQILQWIDQKLRTPLATDLTTIHKQLATLQQRFDELLNKKEHKIVKREDVMLAGALT